MRKLLPGRAWLRVGAAAAVGAVALAACGSSSSNSTTPSSSASASPSGAVSGGTATFALPPATTPNYIFPMTPASSFSVVSISNLQDLMFRPLYWFGGTGVDGTSPTLNESLSVGDLPVYSNGGKTVTITVKPWKFSDGTTANARGVVFWMNLLKAAVKSSAANWGAYVPGLFPDNVLSYKATGPQTVVMQLNKAYSSEWFTYNELSQIYPLPAAWDVEKSGQKPGNYDTTPAGALAVYNHLSAASKDEATYATNPLWKVVDGPWKLTTFQSSTGLTKFTYNTDYSGPTAAKHVTTFVELPYTTDTSEFSALAAGNTIDYGYITPSNISQKSRLTSAGYNFVPWYDWGFDYAPINFNSNTLGYAFRQSYVRDAIQETYDQAADIKAFYAGYGSPTVGPVPTFPKNPFVSSAESHDPFGFSTSNALSLLTSHGWKLIGGVATCESSACGTGVKIGTKLVINMPYASGSLALTQQLDQLKSDAAKAGIDFVLTSEPFDTVIGNTSVCKMGTKACSWEINNWGGGWIYAPDYLPTGEELFQTGASANYGSFSDPEADKLIAATTTSSNLKYIYAYENYLVKNIPVLYQPNPAYALSEISTKLGGVTQESTLNVTPEFWYLTK
jgi:peptide/nickel transport system substrate-binding protein